MVHSPHLCTKRVLAFSGKGKQGKMAFVRCPTNGCPGNIACPDDYDGTMQCDHCAAIARVLVRKGRTIDAKVRGLDFQIPDGLPAELRPLLSQAVACFDAGSPAATVVLAGLFIEGLLAKQGITGDRLVDMIDAAHKAARISTLGYHVATASRLIRNIGAHYSEELVRLTESDARLVLEMTRKLATDILGSAKD
jgi:hypothetical protein